MASLSLAAEASLHGMTVPADTPLLILGGGGHAAVVVDTARAAGWRMQGVLDDDRDLEPVLGCERLGPIGLLETVLEACEAAVGHAAVGDASLRESWSERLGERLAPPIVHPSAQVASSAVLGAGVFVGPLAVVNARASIGVGVIVNSSAVVEHDTVVEAFAHIGPAAVIGGAARIGRGVLVGLGARVRPGVILGAGCTLGAGAVLIGDLSAGATAVGNPAGER